MTYEDNDDHSCKEFVDGGAQGLWVCDEDEDWFVVSAEVGDLLQADMSSDVEDIDIKLFHEDDVEQSISLFRLRIMSLFSLRSRVGVIIFGCFILTPSPEAIVTIYFFARTRRIVPDAAEENDTLETATPLTEN